MAFSRLASRAGASSLRLSRSPSAQRAFPEAGIRSFAALSKFAWSEVPMAPRDPILGVQERFLEDKDENKVNLGIGAYRDDDGKPVVLASVAQAERRIFEDGENMEYAPVQGLNKAIELGRDLAFSAALPANAEGRIASIQSLSGTGALRLLAGFIKQYTKHEPTIYMANPTWGNHFKIFEHAGLSTGTYRYWEPNTKGLDIDGMLEDIQKAPKESVFVLHAVAHNPTGVDPTQEQWDLISKACLEAEHFVLFDMAYQGFASGDLERDAFAVRKFVEDGHEVALAQSFAKNMGLYGHRVGIAHMLTDNGEQAANVQSQLKILARGMYSSPPVHGGRIVANVLGNPELRGTWENEVKGMADRIIEMRHLLKSNLKALGSSLDWEFMTEQIGMFCFTGLDQQQVKALVEEWHIHMTADGRISMAGVNTKNVGYISEALHAVTK